MHTLPRIAKLENLSGVSFLRSHFIPICPIHSFSVSDLSHPASDQEQSHTLLWPLRTHRNLVFLQTRQLRPWESDPPLDLSQAQQWHFGVGAAQIPASLVPQYVQGHRPRLFKDQLCPWGGSPSPGLSLPTPMEAQQGGSHWLAWPSGAPKVPIKGTHGWQIKVQIQLGNYLRLRWKGVSKPSLLSQIVDILLAPLYKKEEIK